MSEQLQIREGCFYKNRKGEKIGPMECFESRHNYFHRWKSPQCPCTAYGDCGRLFSDLAEDERDLISEWPAEAKPGEVDPGEGWRISPLDEEPMEGDECTQDNGKHWQKSLATKPFGTPNAGRSTGYVYRRRLAPASVESAPVVDTVRPRDELTYDQLFRGFCDYQSQAIQLQSALADLKRANAELLERCMIAENEQDFLSTVRQSQAAMIRNLTAQRDNLRERVKDLEGSLATAKVICDGIKEIKQERDQARKAILKFGNGADFDWNILGKIDELEQERDELKAQLAALKATAANEGQEWRDAGEWDIGRTDVEVSNTPGEWMKTPRQLVFIRKDECQRPFACVANTDPDSISCWRFARVRAEKGGK